LGTRITRKTPPEDHASFERSSHFYERREGDGYLRRPTSAYHVTDPLRGRTRDRLYRNGPYTPLIERAQPTHHRALGNAWSYDGTTSGRYPTTTPTPDPYPEERRETQPVVHKKRPKSSRSGSESGSNSGSSRSRSRSRSRSHSSSSSSQSGSSSCSSGTSSPGTDKSCSPHSVQSEDRRPLAICVRNLPIRSSDTSLKDGLFHEYKKHGKVTWVKVVGQAGDRYALVCFKKPDDVDKALEESHNKLFFGCKIEVAPYTGYDVEDNEFRPYEAELDEFHPKATRTLFIGNLEKDITASELRKHFEQFGEIIEIDIKKQGVSSYAFCQYADIASVVKAIRTMDGEHLGSNRIKLGFGKSMATNCVWVDGIADTAEKYLNMQFSQFGSVTHMAVDRERGHALIYFEQIPYAQDAVREMRGVLLRNRKLQVDFASRECQEAFYEHLEKQGQAVGGERPWERYDSNSREVQAGRFETTVVVPGARFARYETQPRPRAASYNRTSNCSSSSIVTGTVGATVGQSRTAGRTQRSAQRYEYYDTEYPDRRYRNYDEFSQGSAASHDDSYEQELRDYGYCQPRPAKSCSPGDKVPCNEDDPTYKRHSLQSVVVSSDVAAPSQLAPPSSAGPVHPLDIRHLQKERVHIQNLLEQLESSGDDDGSMSTSAPKKRLKLASDDCGEPPPPLPICGVGPSGLDVCYENHSDVGAPSLVVTTHNHRKSVSEVRRLSDVSSKHCSRRLSTDSASKHGNSGREVRETSADRLVSVQSYSPHPVCKRRKTGSSTSESEDRVSCRSGKHSHHHHHHQHGEPASNTLTISGGESIDGSRPGTPLCDERPENLLPPTEPRRFPRDRLATEGPLSLPLPRFAAQVLSSTPRLPVSVSANKATSVSSPPAVHQPPPSPGPAPPPSSPPPRPPSLPSSSSSDSELSPPSPTLEERIRSLDEKYEKWSGSRALSAAGGDALAKLDASASERFRFRHKLLDLDLNDLPPSDIVKSVLAKRSVFDEDSKRLENFSDKYEPREFIPYTRTTGCFQSLRIMTECKDYTCATPAKPLSVVGTPTTPGITGKVGSFPNPGTPQLPSRLMGTPSPLHSPSHTPTTPTPLKSHVSLSPVGITPLHPPCVSKQQTLPKTPSTGLPAAAAKGLQYPFPSHPPVLPTTTVATTTATTAVPTSATAEASRSSMPRPSVTVLTTATGTKPTAEVTTRVPPKLISSAPAPSSSSNVLLRLQPCVKPSTVSIPLDIETTRTSAGDVSRFQSSTTCTTTRVSSASSLVTPKVSLDQSPKITKEPSAASSSSNIPSLKSPDNVVVSACSPRVVIVPVSVTTAVASSTATTTVLTMTMASTIPTTTTFTTSVTTPTTNSSSEASRSSNKIKSCVTSKKEQASQPQQCVKDKQLTSKDSNKESESRSSNIHKGKSEEKRKDSVGSISSRRDSDESSEKEKRRDSTESIERDRRKEVDTEKDKRKDSVDSLEKDRRKEECTENLDRRKESIESSDKERWKEEHIDSVDKEENQDKERRKENHMTEKECESMDNAEKRSKERRKERGSSSGSPASIGCKRRMSSQDSVDSVPDDAKRLKLEHRKIGERRDSKDSGRSSSSSKRSSSERPRSHDNKNFAKLLEDKIREDTKHQQSKDEAEQQRKKDVCEKHKTKDKQKKKNKVDRESPKEMREFNIKPIKEPILEKESSPKSCKKKEDSDTEEKHKHGKREAKDKKKQAKDEFGSNEFLDEKARGTKKDREKRNSSERRKDDDQKLTSQKKDGKKKECSNSDSDSEEGGDGPKKHSIFDIVDDGPAYISMYDKVKARSTKNMQKQEEERRQEKMREKFNLFKQSREQSRAKREEKKRSTSWDEDSDSDNERGNKCKRHVKLMISSSSEDDGRTRYDGDEPKLSKSRPIVRIKKEDICLDSDSEFHSRALATANKEIRRPLIKQEGSEDDDSSARTKHVTTSGKKGNRTKLVSDTSEDDSVARFKPNVYSADSDADQGFADSDEKLPTSKKSVTKNNRMGKGTLESSNDESSRKLILDVTKTSSDKPANVKKPGNKNKFNKSVLDSSDDEYNRKFVCELSKSETYPEEKLAEDESSRKLSDILKTDVYGTDKQSNLKKSVLKNKSKLSVDSSDEENDGKLPTTPKSDIFDSGKKFLSDTEKSDMYGESLQAEKLSDCEVTASTPPPQLEKPSFHENSIETVEDVPRKKSSKKKHKRQKNLSTSEDGLTKMGSTESDILIDKPDEEEGKLKGDGERKKHKRERRNLLMAREKKKGIKPELGPLKAESSLKREDKMEDIFGPLSDDSEGGHAKNMAASNGNTGRMFDKLPKWQVSMVYGSDSDSNASRGMDCYPQGTALITRPLEKERKRRDKKKRDKKASSVELVEAGRALEAKLLSSDDYPEPTIPKAFLTSGKTEKNEDETVKEEDGNNESDVFRFTDGDESLEAATAMLFGKAKEKEKKKKRKKSKEEKQNRREHHHHHHHDKSKSSPERKLSISSSMEDSKPSSLLSPSLPSLDMPTSPLASKPDDTLSMSPSQQETVPVIPVSSVKSNEKKKPDKFIPGFGTDIDDKIHETAVKSISEFEAPKPKVDLHVKEESVSKVEQVKIENDTQEEEKPRAVISQEETEDAVAALLGESFGADFTSSECYVGDGNSSPHAATHIATEPALPTDEEEETRMAIEAIDMKPETPQSEPDLQIDTDTDGDPEPTSYTGIQFSGDDHSPHTPDRIDFSRPPKTPDLPASYYSRQQQQQQNSKSFEQESIIVKPEECVSKHMSSDDDLAETNNKHTTTIEKQECDDQSKVEPEVEPEPTNVSEEPAKEDETKQSCDHKEHVEEKEISDIGLLPDKLQESKTNQEDTVVKVKEEDSEVNTPVVVKTEPKLESDLTDITEENQEIPSCDRPILSSSSTLTSVSTESQNTTMKEVDALVKEEPKPDDKQDFGQYTFNKDANKDINSFDKETENKEIHAIPTGNIEYKPKDTDVRLDRGYISTPKEDSGFVSVIKEEHPSDIARESDFSEPETDMKADEIVASLLASASMNQALNADDNSRSGLETDVDRPYSPFKEREIEVISVIKEPDHRFKEDEQDPFASPIPGSPTSKENYEALANHKGNKNDLSDVIKADSDYWSAKEVNIESVIKKVDALCSDDDMRDFEKPLEPVIAEEVKKESEPEVAVETTPKDVPLKTEEIEPIKEEEKNSGEVKEKEKEQEVVQVEPHQEEKTPLKEEEEDEEEEDEVETEADTSLEKDDQTVTEEESPVSGASTPRSTGRGGRGGARSKAPVRMSGVTTRRSRLAGNQRATAESLSVAPVSPRRANKKLTTDVYEFRDDSEDEGSNNSGEKGRPRLILTIKSPQASIAASGKEIQVKTVPAPVPVVETREEFPSPTTTTTRKSRRLQERDGPRTTVDDVIDDVVRSAGKVTRSAAAAAAAAVGLGLRPRRSTRQNIAAQKAAAISIPETPRKSPRGGKKQQAQQRRLSEALDESGDDKKKDEDVGKSKAEEISEPEKENTETSPVKSPESPIKKKAQPEKEESEPSTKPSPEEDDGEPTTLIDPVTGLLIPMRESEEGQYIPVTTAPVITPVTSSSQVSMESQRNSNQNPNVDKGSATVQKSGYQISPPPEIPSTTSSSPQSHVPVISNAVTKPLPLTTVATPVVSAQRLVSTAKIGVETITCSAKPVPQSLKAHVLQQTVKTVASPPATVLPPPPSVKTTIATMPHQKALHQTTTAGGKSVPMNPKAHLLQAVAGGQMVVVGPPPGVSKIHHAPAQPVNMKTTAPAALTPKAHLLQAASAGPPKAGNFIPQQKSAPQPPKAHHGPSQQPILTGAVASPPLKAPHLSSQQPIGASSSRATVPKPQVPPLSGPHLAQHGKGLMDPPKVEVSIGGCIVVPTASPQSRSQVLQDCRTAGLPVPYETQIHAGSGGVVADLLPNPQFVLTQRQQSPPPAHQQGEVAQHVGFSHHMRNPPHDMAQHYVHPMMYHPYLRAHPDALTAHIPHYLTQGAVRSPIVPGLEVKSEPESEEARGSSPPLELRRPSSNGTVARGSSTVAHSLQSPHDRTTDSPQVATVYVHPGSRLTHYTTAQQLPPRYYEPGAEPPPAHLRTPRHHHHPLPGSEAPPTQPRLQVATPPHASQVPPQADSLLMLLQRYPVMWQGLLALKNDQAAVQMHFVFGNPHVARESLPCNSDGSTPPLRIAQRMRLEQTQVEGVARKMQIDNEHCMLLALPCGRDHMDVLQQSNNLQTGFITYLQQKQAAGIVNIAVPGSQQAAYVVHIFPSCDFANENLARIAPDLLHRVADIAHLLIIIATVICHI
ncbi:hypothetical protein L9F63_001313, partial [Diploptera punctata]